MASGVKVADEVKDLYNDMKVVKSDADAKERIRIVLLEIKDGYIVVEQIKREKDLEGQDVYEVFVSLLNPKECRYLLYDCHFGTVDSPKEELVFVMWAPESAPIKLKMQYASSKDSLKKTLSGCKHEWQINDLADCSQREVFAERLGRKVISIEGKAV